MQQMVARSELRELVCRYAIAVDSRDIDDLVDLYWPDDGTRTPVEYRRRLRSRFDGSLAGVGVSFMNVGTQVVDDLTDSSATGQTYCRSEFALDGRWTHQAILYRDRYVRVDGRWYFHGERGHQLFYGAPHGVDPLLLPPVTQRRDRTGMGEVPGTWPSWAAFWRRLGVPLDQNPHGRAQQAPRAGDASV
jgi:hypothetical protein